MRPRLNSVGRGEYIYIHGCWKQVIVHLLLDQTGISCDSQIKDSSINSRCHSIREEIPIVSVCNPRQREPVLRQPSFAVSGLCPREVGVYLNRQHHNILWFLTPVLASADLPQKDQITFIQKRQVGILNLEAQYTFVVVVGKATFWCCRESIYDCRFLSSSRPTEFRITRVSAKLNVMNYPQLSMSLVSSSNKQNLLSSWFLKLHAT